MHKIVIHGASSFLGKHFVRLLTKERVPFSIVARESSHLPPFEAASEVSVFRYRSSLSELDASLLKVERPLFYELSWHGVYGSDRNHPSQLTVNIPMFIQSVEFAHSLGASHWVGIGSQAEYGPLHKAGAIDEGEACHPTTTYGEAKLHAQQITELLCKAFGIEYSWLRLFSVYGPEDTHNWLIPYLIQQMLQNRKVEVTKGEQMWDYLFVEDISWLLYRLCSLPGVGVANLGSGNPVSIRRVIEQLRELCKSESEILFGAVPYRDDQVMHMEADISKLKRLTGWIPATPLTKGLQETVAYYENAGK